MAAAIARLGPDVKTRDVLDRVTCSACGAKVPASLSPANIGPGGRTSERRD